MSLATLDKKPFHLIGIMVTIAVMWTSVLLMIEGRASILRDGQNVTLKTQPIDPRDLLRGRYVRLNFDISRVQVPDRANIFDEANGSFIASDLEIYVILTEGADGHYVASGVSFDLPTLGSFIKGKIRNYTNSGNSADGVEVFVEYGIERFYASETVAPDLEKQMREGAITDIVVAINDAGKAQIRALMQGERIFFTEELY